MTEHDDERVGLTGHEEPSTGESTVDDSVAAAAEETRAPETAFEEFAAAWVPPPRRNHPQWTLLWTVPRDR